MRKLIALATVLIFAFAPLSAGAGPSPRAETPALSAVGDRAIQDLRRCLATQDTLDVYYLIDASGSLFSDSGRGQVGTDPDFVRAEVLSESLKQLASLSDDPVGLTVNWNAGFFGTSFYPAAETWLPLSAETSDEWSKKLGDAVRGQGPSGATDWLTALSAAQLELAQQKRVSGGCQVLIWLTDGGLNVSDDDTRSSNALNTICGQRIASRFAPPALGLGPLFEMRQSGVTVLGVLLDVAGPGVLDTYPERKTWMQALVEGSGPITIAGTSTTVNCGDGTGLLPEGHAAGAFIKAKTPGDLAIQFLRLGGLIRGGSTSVINADGTFNIDPGVARVSLLFQEPLSAVKLSDNLGNDARNSPGVTFSENSGASSIEIEIDSASDFGTWRIAGTEPTNTVLIAFGGLGLNPNSENSLVTGTISQIEVGFMLIDDELFSISDYDFIISVYQVGNDGTSVLINSGTEADFSDGNFAFGVTPELGLTKMNLRFEITNLVTRVGQTKLAGLSLEQALAVALPANFPTFTPVPLDLGILKGRLNPAEAMLTVTAPESGGSGYLCLPQSGQVLIESDSEARNDTWDWNFRPTSGALDAEGCIQLLPGEQQSIMVSANNSITANSLVKASVPIVLKDETGATLEVALPVSLETVRVINPLIYTLLTALMILLAVLLPLLINYVINRLTTKVEHGNELLQATLPASYDISKESVTGLNGLNLKGSEIGLDQFKFQSPKTDSTSFDISKYFLAKSKVSLNPLAAPWFELQAKEGYRVFTSKSTKRAKGFKQAQKAEFSGQLSKLWAVAVAESDLKKVTHETTELPVQLVVFARNAGGANPDFQDRMVNVINDAKLKRQFLSAREEIRKSEESKVRKVPLDPGGPAESSGTKPKIGAPPTGPGLPGNPTAFKPPRSGPPAAPGIPGTTSPTDPGKPPGGPIPPSGLPPKLS
jgi:hypothetical protein